MIKLVEGFLFHAFVLRMGGLCVLLGLACQQLREKVTVDGHRGLQQFQFHVLSLRGKVKRVRKGRELFENAVLVVDDVEGPFLRGDGAVMFLHLLI